MRVVRDFERVYKSEDDPWAIGDASSERYNRYCELVRPHVRGAVLDIGCGFGAFLARLQGTATTLDGVEISDTAIAKGAARFPSVAFHRGSAADLDAVTGLSGRQFDLIICSDVVYYLPDRAKVALLSWVAAHLTASGKAFIAAWCPGGAYLTGPELAHLVRAHLVSERIDVLSDSGHVAILARRRRRLVAITLDYETWHPIPEGKRIDWNADIFEPTARLLEVFGRSGVAATFFVEMGEYFWLDRYDPAVARRMEDQWREIVARGHDVQLHLHPCWLPETGATFADGQWHWDWSKAKAQDYPGDLSELIGRCKRALETAIRPVKPDYAVTCFRAGAYQAQPFERLARALIENGITCDSSVHPHGVSKDRGYDYSHAYSRHQPYFADLLAPQLKAVPAEEQIIELPIFTPEDALRWSIDSDEGEHFAARLVNYDRRHSPGFSMAGRRTRERARKLATTAYCLGKPPRRLINSLVPRAITSALVAFDNPRAGGNRYYVAIGHTKAALRLAAIERNLASLKASGEFEFVTLSDMARVARLELDAERRANAAEEISFQVERERPAVLGEGRNEAQSQVLQDMVPFDVERILDFGCGAGYWSARLAELYPWVEVVGVDAGADFIAKAERTYEGERVRFEVGDFAKLSFADAAFDCVYADNTLEHCFDLDATLSEIYRVLKTGGCLVAALPLDGLNPDQVCDNHTWKTIAPQAVARLSRAGFVNIRAEEVDTYLRLGMPPYRPSNDRMLYVRAWKCPGGESELGRARRAMDWIYRRLEPSRPNLSKSARQIISDGFAYCMGYTVALGELLRREGFDATWITMRADGHAKGSGPRQRDSHETIEVVLDGKRHVLDPMSNTVFPYALEELLRNPRLADACANRDERCIARQYGLYNTAYWYERVSAVARRQGLRLPFMIWKKVKK